MRAACGELALPHAVIHVATRASVFFIGGAYLLTGSPVERRAEPDCITDNLLGFEMLRLAEMPAAPEPTVKRAAGDSIACLGCSSPDGELGD
jgi:hypothetical protein